jgi:Ca2+-binding RTX toxin-like protein
MWTVTFGTTNGVSSTILNSIQQVTLDAANYWGRYIDFNGTTLDIQVNIISLGSSTLAQAGPERYVFTRTVGSADVFQAIPILELQAGSDQNGAAHEIEIDVNLDSINANEYFYGGLANPNVPFSQFDLFTILAHELGHGLGFISFDPVAANDDRAEYDIFKSGNFFTGPRAVAVNGGNVPLQSGDGSHLNVFDLLFPSIANGERNFVSALDVAILADAGLPILEPTSGDDSLFGFERFADGGTLVGGNDVASLLGGNDWYSGLGGTDSIDGGAGGDTLFGDAGNDTLRGGADNDVIDGGAGFDSLFGDAGSDLFNSGASDAYDGGADFDAVSYAAETNAIRVIAGAGSLGAATSATFVSIERIVGGSGNDTISGLAANEDFEGGAGADSLSGQDGDDLLTGGLGNDTLTGGNGNDTAAYSDKAGGVFIDLGAGQVSSGGALDGSGNYAGGAVEDTLFTIERAIGSSFGDRIVTTTNSRVFAGGGGDVVVGAFGLDEFSGDAGNDTINGGGNADTISGGLGNDVLDGGTAFDTLDYSEKSGGVNVNVINGVALTGGFINSSGFYQGGAQEDTISNFENILGTGFADRLIAGSTSASISGFGGDDFLFTFSGNDTLFGGEGNDFISTARSSDQLFGENGNDTLNGGTGTDTLNGGANTDTADYSDRTGAVSVNLTTNIALTGGALNASGFYSGGFTEDSLVSIEAVFGSAFGDRLVAGAFSSRLEGRDGADNISGLGGFDTLIGGAGNDTLSGGAAADQFDFASGFGIDRITDFVEGAGAGDVIRLLGLGAAFDTFAEVIAVATQSGADVVFNFGGGNAIEVANAVVAGFNVDDFLFG